MSETPDAAQEFARLQAVVAEHRAKLDADPSATFPAYADALMALAGMVSGQGQLDEALALSQEGIDHLRLLHEADETFGVHLSSGLNNLSNRLSDLGRDDEARQMGDEALGLAQKALEHKPTEARFVLVSTLMNQSGRSWRSSQSLRALEEMGTAVDVFREGGESLYGFLGVMVDALHRNSMALSENGLWEEAVAVRRMTAQIFPGDKVPAAVHHLLALTLQQAAYAKSRDGFPGEALPMVEEAAELARGLAEVAPDQYKLFLAQSLASLASRQHEAHADAEALDSAVESVNAFQELAKSKPGEALGPLVVTLETFASILTTLGHGEQAKTVLAQRDHLASVLEGAGKQ